MSDELSLFWGVAVPAVVLLGSFFLAWWLYRSFS